MRHASLSRREVLATGLGLAGGVLAAPAAGAATWRDRADRLLHAVVPWNRSSMPADGTATLMVGGPPDGLATQFARLIAPSIATMLFGPSDAPGAEAGSRITIDPTGGRDGVTAANAFDARANPDGTTALVVPGHAALAWLAGDPRVHYDAGTWVPVLATLSPVAVVGRPDAIDGTGEVRLGGSNPSGCVLPALIALDLLGVPFRPVFGLDAQADADAALRAGTIDLAVVSGHDVPSRVAALAGSGFPPLFALGAGPTGAARDPSLPSVPTFDEQFGRRTGAAPSGPLAGAFRASAAAARLDTATVLPALAPAASVARWRQACGQAVDSLSVQSATRRAAIQPEPAPGCVEAVRAIVASEPDRLALHRVLANRFGWQPA